MSPSNSSSSSPKTDQRLNAIVVAVQEKRKMTNPIQVSPQEVVPGMTNPKQASPQELVPEVNNPRQVSPDQEVVPEVNDPKQVSPDQEVVPEVNDPKQVSPDQEVVPEVNDPKQGSPQEVVPERNNTERPSSDLRVLRSINKLMNKYPSRDKHALICNICKRGFPNAHSLCSHQKTHMHELELERKMNQVVPSYSPGQYFWKKPDNFGGFPQDALSNDNHFGISRGSVRNMNMGCPFAPPYGNTSYGFYSRAPFVTHNYNRPNLSDLNRSDLPFGPCNPNGGGSNSNYHGGFTMAPPATPYRPFIVNPSYGSLPYYNYGPHDSTTTKCSNNKSSSQGAISLELTLGPSKWIGGSNNDRNVYPSLDGGVSGGGSMDMNVPPPLSPVTSLSNDENVPGSSCLKEENEVMVVDDDEKDDHGVTKDHDADQPGRS